MEPVRLLRRQAGLTQAELARRAGTSQPTVAAYESGAKSPTYRTLERLASSVGLEVHVVLVPELTREERRSLELHRAIADKVAANPDDVLQRARQNVRKMARVNPGARPILRAWRDILELPTDQIVEVLVDPRLRARELRHVTPFAGVLTPAERWSVYRGFRESDAA